MTLNKEEAKPKLNQVVEHFTEELKKLRTGRATASMLDGINVEVYGQSMPLKHIASITVLDAQMLQIAPFDPNNLDAISTAIRDQQALGLNPADDGKVVRVPMPPMTEERRQEVVKQLHEKVEEAKVALRNIRHEVLQTAKHDEKDKRISEDEYHRVDKDMSKMLDEATDTITELAKNKETEIMTV